MGETGRCEVSEPRNLLAGSPVTVNFQGKPIRGDETVANYTPDDLARDRAVVKPVEYQEPETENDPPRAFCRDCGKPYRDFKLDTTLPDEQWLLIHPEGNGGLLCANCMVRRAAKLPGIIAARMVLEFSDRTETARILGEAK
jgi:hypothetical protein